MPHTAIHLPAAFKRLAWSNLAAQSAEQIGLAAAPLIAVLALGAGPGATGYAADGADLAVPAAGDPGGPARRPPVAPGLMVCAEALRAASLAAILVLVALGLLSLPLLAFLGFLGAAGTVAYGVAAPSLVPALVPEAALATANARIELARTVAFAGGPALAGALVGWTGAAPAFAFAAALSTLAVLLFAGLREPARPKLPPRHPLHDLKEGAAFVFGNALLRPLFATQLLFNISFFVLQAVYVPYAVHRLGLSAAAVGATLATYGIGMVAGALSAGRISRALPFGIVIAVGQLAGLTAAVLMVVTIWLPSAVG